VYDITSRGSFEEAQSWLRELRQHGRPDIVIMLVGNKLDLDGERAVALEEAFTFADKNDLAFMETSAKTDVGVSMAFNSVIQGVCGATLVLHLTASLVAGTTSFALCSSEIYRVRKKNRKVTPTPTSAAAGASKGEKDDKALNRRNSSSGSDGGRKRSPSPTAGRSRGEGGSGRGSSGSGGGGGGSRGGDQRPATRSPSKAVDLRAPPSPSKEKSSCCE
jgi:hypothetical protein